MSPTKNNDELFVKRFEQQVARKRPSQQPPEKTVSSEKRDAKTTKLVRNKYQKNAKKDNKLSQSLNLAPRH